MSISTKVQPAISSKHFVSQIEVGSATLVVNVVPSIEPVNFEAMQFLYSGYSTKGSCPFPLGAQDGMAEVVVVVVAIVVGLAVVVVIVAIVVVGARVVVVVVDTVVESPVIVVVPTVVVETITGIVNAAESTLMSSFPPWSVLCNR